MCVVRRVRTNTRIQKAPAPSLSPASSATANANAIYRHRHRFSIGRLPFGNRSMELTAIANISEMGIWTERRTHFMGFYALLLLKRLPPHRPCQFFSTNLHLNIRTPNASTFFFLSAHLAIGARFELTQPYWNVKWFFFRSVHLSGCENWKFQWMVMHSVSQSHSNGKLLQKRRCRIHCSVGEFHPVRLRRLMSQDIIKNSRINFQPRTKGVKGLTRRQTPLTCYENSNRHFFLFLSGSRRNSYRLLLICLRPTFMSFSVVGRCPLYSLHPHDYFQ